MWPANLILLSATIACIRREFALRSTSSITPIFTDSNLFSAVEKQCGGKSLLLFLISLVACKHQCTLKTSACVVLSCHSHGEACSCVIVP